MGFSWVVVTIAASVVFARCLVMLSLNTSYLVPYLITVGLRLRLALLLTVYLKLENCFNIDSYLRLETCFTIDLIL